MAANFLANTCGTRDVVDDLEVNFQRKLKISWIARACNCAEGRGAETSTRIIERRSVGDVENLRTKLQAHALRDPKRLPQHQIRVLQSRSSHRVPRAVPDRKLRRKRERRYIEPLRRASIRQRVGIAHSVRALRAIP